MKQSKIITAYRMLEALADNEHLSKKEQWNLYKLRCDLKPHVEFQVEQEELVRKKYEEFADDKGIITGEKAESYVNEIKSISEIEVDLELKKPQIRMTDGITFKIIEPLEEFVEFLPPEE